MPPDGRKTPPDFLVEGTDVPLELEHLFGEFGNDAGGDVLSGQGGTLDFGRVESILGEATGTFDAAIPKVGGDALASRPSNLCRSLVVGNQGEGTLSVQVEDTLQGGNELKIASLRRAMVRLWSVTRSRRRVSRSCNSARASSPSTSSPRSHLMRA